MNDANRDDQLFALCAALEQHPWSVDLLCRRAALLAARGQAAGAQADYLAAIRIDPDRFDALNDLGTLLHRTDFRTAARTVYAEVVRRHPDNPVGRVNYGNALLAADDHAGARVQFEAALALDPGHPDAHQGMANIFQDLGAFSAAEDHRQASYRRREPSYLPSTGAGAACHMLQLVSAAGGNTPTRFLLDPDYFAITTIVVEAFPADKPLPRHDVVFNAVGDADLCGEALGLADALLAQSPRRVVNAPQAVLRTGRTSNAERLGGDGVRTPRMRLATRSEIETAAAAFGFPLLVRSPGYHTGRHFVRVESLGALKSATSSMPGDELLLIEPLSSASTPSRKYRVMSIAGRLYPLHLAIGQDWKVHYFTADMAQRADYRVAEADFLNDMSVVLGPRAMAGLARIAEALDLDYAGIDFGVGHDGEVLLYEANAAMVVNPAPPDPIWDYRRSAVDAILNATKALIFQRAGRGAAPGSAIDEPPF